MTDPNITRTTITSFPNDYRFAEYRLLMPLSVEIVHYPSINLYYARVPEAPLCNPCFGIDRATAINNIMDYLVEQFEDPQLERRNRRVNETLINLLRKYITRSN